MLIQQRHEPLGVKQHTGMSVCGSLLRLMLRLDTGAELLGLGLGRLPYVYVGFKEAA